MVLVTVLMIVIVMMILSVSILSQHMTQSNSSQAQVEQIQADQLAKGIFWNTYSAGAFANGTTTFSANNRTYNSTVATQGSLTNVQISY
ncbi:hypothetical protein [Phenylobacterium sp.]|uniref:hypothetical protein n=1 Tax=Phenylobacterium sp. TaxID=1871053 RepID=UPI0027221E81|nr:hypothetical protein [Phenylobacterium sp.]MDO8801785.1 hypothetical protein [Phenylobacterium sp.]